MRISRQTSQGRGEYELSESHGDLTPEDLTRRSLIIDFDGWSLETGVYVSHDQGKRRLRRLLGDEDGEEDERPAKQMQLPRQVATVLLMPLPTRSRDTAGAGFPLLRQGDYSVEDINLDAVQLVGADQARIHIAEIVLGFDRRNEPLDYSRRYRQVAALWQSADRLPEPLRGMVAEHSQMVRNGPLVYAAAKLVAGIQKATTLLVDDLGLPDRTKDMDALGDLLRVAGTWAPPPRPAQTPDEIEPDDLDLRRRVEREYRQWAASVRGPEAAKFRREVQRAYNYTCIVCGLRWPSTKCSPKPGVDAAHLLPWTEYELDDVRNGVCLCKQHHWAFDERLITFTYSDGTYFVELNAEKCDAIRNEHPDFPLHELARHAGPIEAGRLPQQKRKRPDPGVLERLNQSE